MDKVVKYAARVSYQRPTLNATIHNHSQLIAGHDNKNDAPSCSGACLRRMWTGGGRDTPAGPPPQLLEVALLVDLLAPAARTPKPSRPWVHLCMHDKEINIENARMMHDVMMKSQRNIKQGITWA